MAASSVPIGNNDAATRSTNPLVYGASSGNYVAPARDGGDSESNAATGGDESDTVDTKIKRNYMMGVAPCGCRSPYHHSIVNGETKGDSAGDSA
ncbi:hypothetical protein ABW19_dt0205865 [Dactylella cylindrospora]|nr:hypothetical protein ABW19_dt0205865 [Dactylella cylindrospora]